MDTFNGSKSRRLRDLTEGEITVLMRGTAKSVLKRMPPGTVFAVLVFDQPGSVQYATNGRREDVREALVECARKMTIKDDEAKRRRADLRRRQPVD